MTPNQRQGGVSEGILNRRKEILEAEKVKNPERWSGPVQDCTLEKIVWVNPSKAKIEQKICCCSKANAGLLLSMELCANSRISIVLSRL